MMVYILYGFNFHPRLNYRMYGNDGFNKKLKVHAKLN